MTERIVVVTGGARGIGRATATAFARLGDTVYVVDVDEKAGTEVSKVIDGRFLACDVTSERQVEQAVGRIDGEVGRIDVLVNNAGGFSEQLTSDEMTLQQWNRTLELNLSSVFLMTRACRRLVQASAAGRIINIGSLAGQLAGYRTSPAYAAAKAGVHALTRVLASELAPEGTTVNALAPSAVLTDRILELRDEQERQATVASIPLGRYQTPDEVAGWVVFLASTEAGFMTGQTVSVNGGRLMT